MASVLPNLHLSYGVSMFDKETMMQNQHGDDHHFNSKTARTFGVFDGVSGSNKKYGAGAAERAANQMCHASWQEARRQASRGERPSPRDILIKAHSTLVEQGSTTACVAAFHKIDEEAGKALLVVANVGDCGLIVVRPRLHGQGKSYGSYSGSETSPSDYGSGYATSSSCSDPDTMPKGGDANGVLIFQTEVKRYKGKMSKPHTLSAKTSRKSLIKKMDLAETVVEVGDYIVVGSDGLWDNVQHEQVAHEIMANQDKRPAQIAAMLGKMAVSGHKRDDITVLVGRVVSDADGESKDA
jgi:serine/threonine protein phosphatase PrpC